MAHYKGAASEGNRAANLMKKRERQKEELELLKKKIADEHGTNKFEVQDKFATSYDVVEEQLKSSTIGLVTLEEMKEKQEILVKAREKQIAAKLANKEAEQEARKKQRKSERGALSFNLDEDEEEDEDEEASPCPPQHKKKRLGKDPAVDTSFLPDRDREDAERREREELRQNWVTQQEKIKSEEIQITYSYWDGSGHRRTVKMKKGDSIHRFLAKVLDSIRKEFTELRAVNVDNLMYIKEDLIIPHHYSFYDFIINKARGKSGPLFSFDVHDDVRLISDASVERDESHAGKVVLRSWYERNKHIFPASRWEPYDPEKSWDVYTIGDKQERANK